MRIFGPNKSARYVQSDFLLSMELPALPLPAASYFTGKSSTCHTESRNTKREVGQVAFTAALADGGWRRQIGANLN